MGAPVELEEEARLDPPGPPTPVPRGAPPARRDHSGGAQDPLHRGAAHCEPLDGGELLGEVDIIEAGIPPAGQGDDLGPEGLREAMRRAPRPVAMEEGGWPLPAEPHPEPPHLPGGQPQGFGGLAQGDPSPLQKREHVQLPFCVWGQSHLSSSQCEGTECQSS
jgi:hypothetical protein